MFSGYIIASSGCRMVSVMDQGTWKQSNRRLLLIAGI